MKPIKSLIVIAALFISTISYAESSSPVPMLKHAADNIISTLKKNKSSLKNNHKIIYQAVEHNLLPIVDVVGMSRSVLGRQAWKKATKAQKRQFIKAFTQLVIRTYASPLAEYSDETVKFMPVRGSIKNRFVRVNSVIVRTNAPDIPLNYSLVSKKNQWKIYDLSVEGVSLLQSFRSQFGQALQNSSIEELISEMQKRKAA